MGMQTKKILIIDEAGFARICSAILQKERYFTTVTSDIRNIAPLFNYEDFGLIITSYPYGAGVLPELLKMKLPVIILSDRLNRNLAIMLENVDKSLLHCMIKPLDYTKFRTLVNQIMGKGDGNAEQAIISNAAQSDVRMELRNDQ